MRLIRTIWPVVPTLLIAWTLLPRHRALADDETREDTPTVAVSLPPMPHALPSPIEAVEVLAALHYWTRQPEQTLRPWAAAIADTAPTRADAIWLASQASVESRFAPYVLDYRCNEETGWSACDAGWAIGPWQMHDRKMLHATPEVQARRAYQWMRARPQAWTTWRAARAQADAWLAAQ